MSVRLKEGLNTCRREQNGEKMIKIKKATIRRSIILLELIISIIRIKKIQ
jgi:hypothetical protein